MAQFLNSPKLDKMTASERRFYDLLKNKLDDDYLVWYDLPSPGPRIRYPDYLIFHPQRGLLAIEIKGWPHTKLIEANREQVFLQLEKGGPQTVLANPIAQARDTLLPFISSLQRNPLLLHRAGKYQGKLLLPWGYGCVLSNCERARMPANIDESLEPSKTLYREDLDPAQDAATFRARLDEFFPYRFPLALSTEQINHVRAGLVSQVIINRHEVVFDDRDLIREWPEEIRLLDLEQEQLAHSLGDGHRVIHGVAGSGKTLILQHRALQLAQESAAPVLVVCYNKVLAARLRQRLQGQPNIEVWHFHGLCSELKRRHRLNLFGTFEELPQQLVATLAAGYWSERYGAVLIDEGHDLEADWIRLLVALLEPEKERLLFLYDDAQTLYPKRRSLDFTLSSVNIRARGRRTKILRRNYRNSREIQRYAQNFIFKFIDPADSDDDHIPCLIGEAGGLASNLEPVYRAVASLHAEHELVLKTLNQWLRAGVPPGEIAVLCFSRNHGQVLHDVLRRAAISHQDFIDAGQRNQWQNDRPTLCTMHSSKGLEFSHVIVCGIGQMRISEQWPREQLARVIYVALTRAKSHLLILSSQENEFTRALAAVAGQSLD